jgi:arginine/lysine/ornithine decarboxylase
MRKVTLLGLLVCLIALPARAGLVTQTQWVMEQPTDWTETLRFDPIPEGVDSIHLSATGRLNHQVDSMPPDVTLTLGPSSIVSPYFDFEFPSVQRGLGDLSPVSFVATAATDIPVLPGPFDFTTIAQSFSSFVTPSGNGSGEVTTTASLDVTIAYETPVPIPEPASLVMLGIGVAGIVGLQSKSRFC